MKPSSIRLLRALFLVAGPGFAAACASTVADDAVGERTPQWAANGYLTPGPTDDFELIGLYLTRKACEAALEEWMSRQVVGNSISGECLPIDRH